MVYVGNLEFRFGRMIMFHMVADSDEELLQMADKIGVARKWIQNKGTDRHLVHFDICKSKKVLALKYGAQEMSDRDIVVKYKLAEKLGLSKAEINPTDAA